MPVQGKSMKIDLFAADTKPEIYAQTVYSTLWNPKGAALGRKLSGPLELGHKQINQKFQLHTASTCNAPPDEIAQSLIPLGQTIKNYLTHSKATLFT